jgi:hypothetical protein
MIGANTFTDGLNPEGCWWFDFRVVIGMARQFHGY